MRSNLSGYHVIVTSVQASTYLSLGKSAPQLCRFSTPYTCSSSTCSVLVLAILGQAVGLPIWRNVICALCQGSGDEQGWDWCIFHSSKFQLSTLHFEKPSSQLPAALYLYNIPTRMYVSCSPQQNDTEPDVVNFLWVFFL